MDQRDAQYWDRANRNSNTGLRNTDAYNRNVLGVFGAIALGLSTVPVVIKLISGIKSVWKGGNILEDRGNRPQHRR